MVSRHCDFTADHIWISCDVAHEVWQDMKTMWDSLSPIPLLPPKFINELIAYMAFRNKEGSVPQRRWHTIFRTAAWFLWKSYLTHSFDAPVQTWGSTTTKATFREMIKDRILTKRILSTKELYSNHIYNITVFKA